MNRLAKVKSILFVDEIKFSKNNKDVDDSFYFIGVLTKMEALKEVREKYMRLTKDLVKGFHATKAYKKKAPNAELMQGLTKLIIEYKLKCMVFKYDKERLYSASKRHLTNLSFEESGKFKNHEFQALFYFIQVLDLYLNTKLNEIETPLRVYFDRGIYGVKRQEEFEVNSNKIETITFCRRNKIDLLALPDHVGYVFRNCRIKYNDVNGSKSLNELQIKEANTELINNCISSLISIFNNNLFEFLDIDKWLEEIEKNTTA